MTGKIPPEYAGQTWPYRDPRGKLDENGVRQERFIACPYPPMQIGNPATLVPEFFEFRAYSTVHLADEHPDWFCETCGAWLSKPRYDRLVGVNVTRERNGLPPRRSQCGPCGGPELPPAPKAKSSKAKKGSTT